MFQMERMKCTGESGLVLSDNGVPVPESKKQQCEQQLVYNSMPYSRWQVSFSKDLSVL